MTVERRSCAARTLFLAGATALVSALAACSLPTDAIEPTPTSLIIAPGERVEVTRLGQLVEFTATVLDERGREIEDVPLIWSSENSEILEAVSGPVFRSLANGQATVQARIDPGFPRVAKSGYRSGTVRASADVVVRQALVGMRLTPGTATLWAAGQRRQLTLELLDPGDHPITRDVAVEWRSEDESIATVDTAGVVTALADGDVRITALAGGMSAGAAIRVSAQAPYTACVTFGEASTKRCSTVTFVIRDSHPLP